MSLRDNGPVLMLLAATLFGVMVTLVKSASNIPSSEIIFFRFLIGSILAFLAFKILKIKIQLPQKKLTLMRIVFGFISVYLLFQAISLTYLSNALVLFYTSPLFSIILAHVFLGEKAGKSIIPLFLASFLGILLIIKPDFLSSSVNLGNIYALLSGLFGAMMFTTLKKLESFETAWTLTVVTMYGTLLLALPFALVSFVMPSIGDLSILIAIGILGFFAVSLMTFAFKYCGESEGTELLMFEAVMAAILGFLIFNEVLDLFSIVGFVLVLSSNFYITLAHTHIDIHLHHH